MTNKEENEFLQRARNEVVQYLTHFNVPFSKISLAPDWFLIPYIAIWRVFGERSNTQPGWFAISGDVPTDYVSSSDAHDARQAMRHFSRLWLDASSEVHDRKSPQLASP